MIEEKSVPKRKNKSRIRIKGEGLKLNWLVRRIEPCLWGGNFLLLETVLVETTSVETHTTYTVKNKQKKIGAHR